MGSQIGDPDEITVLVTGFGVCFCPLSYIKRHLLAGPPRSTSHNAAKLKIVTPWSGYAPFRDQYPINPSWEIANSLPPYLPPLRAKDPNSRHAAVFLPKVRIVVHPEPIRVNYRVVRDLVPSFHETPQKFDIVIHIGMAGPRPFYSVERRGHRDGYKHPDVDGEYIDGEEERERNDWPWRGLPEEIETELNLDEILPLWQGHSSEADLRISEDAGHFMCDFIYYSSLSELWKLQRPRKALFLHVPADASPTSVAKGRELTLNLIRSVVESEMIAKNQLLVTKTAEKTSWWGCGSHIQSVIDNVPEAERCECEPKVEVDGASYPPMAASPN
ncbi:pyroglutamyl peptidase type I [Fusarium circinatum]|uniref:Pyroglutamyl peptidase type I n=1 Tax=Fusarium circinatum TaxID=48490 RepID=A0A8H5U7V9_FUSCI|nr:pyroglutamyl peptidase type I [Fusarium circinatum]